MVSIRVSKTFDESSNLSTPANVHMAEWLGNGLQNRQTG